MVGDRLIDIAPDLERTSAGQRARETAASRVVDEDSCWALILIAVVLPERQYPLEIDGASAGGASQRENGILAAAEVQRIASREREAGNLQGPLVDL